jgi:hypothetical protein
MAWGHKAILSTCVALGLSACNFLEVMDFSFSQVGCAFYPETKTGAVNWETARPVNMRIRQGEYWPMVLGFTAERPYVLRIHNADDDDRRFRASGFFDSIAVGLIRVGERDYDTTCLSAITIGPRQTAEIWFVAKRDGRYEFEDQLVPYLFSNGANGVIHISYARTRHISPVSHLIVPEGVPTAPFIRTQTRAPRGTEPPPPVASPRPAVTPAPVELPAAPLDLPAAPKDQPKLQQNPQQNQKPNPQTSEVVAKDQGGLAGFWQSLFN